MIKYEIYQLDTENDDSTIRDFAFRSYQSVVNAGLKITKDRYSKVYTLESCEPIENEDFYLIFNEMRPDDFKGHSLSVSDVVKTPNGYWYCDSFGWKKLDWE